MFTKIKNGSLIKYFAAMYSDDELRSIAKNTFCWHCFMTALGIIVYMYLLIEEKYCDPTLIFTRLILPIDLVRLFIEILFLWIGCRISIWNVSMNILLTGIIAYLEFWILKMNAEELLSNTVLICLFLQYVIYIIYKYTSKIIERKIKKNISQNSPITGYETTNYCNNDPSECRTEG